MTNEQATALVWEYMLLHHQLEKADIIFVLGSLDERVAHYAAELWKSNWAPWLVFSGDGRQHSDELLKDAYGGRTEADHMMAIAVASGVPKEHIIVENRANNSGENYQFTEPLLTARGIARNMVIIVQKPYMERRAYATGKIHWPNSQLIVTSPPVAGFDAYIKNAFDPDLIRNIMVGDLQRIKEYPTKGFQIPQAIPDDVWAAYEYLVAAGYTKRLL